MKMEREKMTKMTKLMTLVMTVAMLFTMGSFEVKAEDSVVEFDKLKIIIDGEDGDYDDVPLIVNDRTMLPLRAVVTKIGIANDDQHIIWNGQEQSVTLIKDDVTVYLKVGSTTAKINDKIIVLDVAPFVYTKNNRTYIPARFVAEAFDKKVLWDGEQKGVIITDFESYNQINEILKKSDEVMKDLTKLKLDMVYDIQMKVEDVDVRINLNLVAKIDNKDSYIEMKIEAEADDEEVQEAILMYNLLNMSNYSVGDKTYTKMLLTGDKWLESDNSNSVDSVDGLEMSTDMEDTYYSNTFSNEVIASSMRLEESEDDKYYILKGDTYQSEIMESSLDYVNGDIDNIDFTDFYLEIMINKETFEKEMVYFVIIMDIEDEFGTIITSTVDLSIKISEINGDFDIVVPEEVLNNLIEESDLLDLFGATN